MQLPRVRLAAWILIAVTVVGCTGRGVSTTATVTDTPRDSGFVVQRLADGVYAVVRQEPLGFINESNSMFVIGDRGVIVVDAQSSSGRTRETLAALRRLTSKPVTAVIHTHWHDDHVTGNEVYREAFPAVEFIGHSTATEDMNTMGVAFRRGAANKGQTIALLRGMVTRQQSFLGGAIDSLEARSHVLSASLLEEYSNGSADFRPLTPTRVVDSTLVLRQGNRDVEVRWLGRGHTRGDLVVFLPRERILATGDLLMWPVQFIGSTSFPGEIPATIGRLRALKANVVVPGHGRVMTGAAADSHADLIGRTARALSTQAEAAVARGETLDSARRHLDLNDVKREMTAGIRLREALFSYYVTSEGFTRAFALATAARAK